MSAFVCRQCRRGYDTEAPEKWVQRYPALRDLCPDCVGVWIVENVPEDRESSTEGGFMAGIKGAGEE